MPRTGRGRALDGRPTATSSLKALRDVVGDAHVVDDPEVMARYVVDWTGRFRGTAMAVVRPANTDEVAAVVSICREHGVGVVPQGGNTGLVGGSVPLEGELVLSLERMTGIADLDPLAGHLL